MVPCYVHDTHGRVLVRLTKQRNAFGIWWTALPIPIVGAPIGVCDRYPILTFWRLYFALRCFVWPASEEVTHAFEVEMAESHARLFAVCGQQRADEELRRLQYVVREACGGAETCLTKEL